MASRQASYRRSILASLRAVGARLLLFGAVSAIVLGILIPTESRWGFLVLMAVYTCWFGAILLGIAIGARRS